MSNLGNIGNIGQAQAGLSGDIARLALPEEATSAFRAPQETVYVDVGAKRIDSNVLRDGVPIGTYQIDPDVLGDIVVAPPVRFTIVSQSIPPGTPVPLGTAVNVMMARPGTLPIGLVSGVHIATANLTMNDGFNRFVAGNPQVRRIVARATSGTLSAADEQAVVELFQNQDIAITNEPGRDVGAAVETLRALTTFGG